MNSNKSLFSQIGHICLYVSDFDASIRFYRDVLKLEPDTKVSTDDFFAFKTGETELALERGGFKKDSEKTRAENPILLQFRAESPEKLIAVLPTSPKSVEKALIKDNNSTWFLVSTSLRQVNIAFILIRPNFPDTFF